MAINAIYTVKENRNIAQDTFLIKLIGPTAVFDRPGQFVNIHIDGFFLRRPISVCDWEEGSITLIYKVMGWGTSRLALFGPGTQLDLLAGLGNGFDVEAGLGKKVLLVGGGVGVPPLYGLARRLVEAGTTPTVLMGFAEMNQVFLREEFEALGCEVLVTTEDGSMGTKGFVTGLQDKLDYNYYYACGPQAMLAAVAKLAKEDNADGQLSFEERMGCGFGTCMGCSCHTLTGPKRVCVDGPVFKAGEVMFE